MSLLNSLQYKSYSLWSCLSKYISIKRYYFRKGSKKKKKGNLENVNWGCCLLLNVLAYDVQYVFKRLSRYAKMLFKFGIIPAITLFNPPQFISYFTFSFLFPFLYLTHSSCSRYNNINEFSEVLRKKMCSWEFHIIHRKKPVLESLFNIVTGLQPSHFIKERLQHRCFPVIIAKFF